MSEQSSKLTCGGDEMGMTDPQFKTYLLEPLENWRHVYDLAVEAGNKEIVAEAEKQITKISTALKF